MPAVPELPFKIVLTGGFKLFLSLTYEGNKSRDKANNQFDKLKGSKAVSYYVQLQIISESLGALHPDQNGFLQLCAEAHCQPVCPCTRPVIGWPGVRDEGSASPEDVSCPSCWEKEKNTHTRQRNGC